MMREVKGSNEPRVQPQRHRRIGGTEIGVLCGVSSFGTTPLDVFNRIVHGVSKFSGNRYSDRGTKYEPEVRRRYVATTGALLLDHPGMVLFEECFACSLDDLALRPACAMNVWSKRTLCSSGCHSIAYPVDYKTATMKSRDAKWGPDGSSEFPENYAYQLRLYMAATRAPFAELFAAFGVDSFKCGHCGAPCDDGVHPCPEPQPQVHFDIQDERWYRLERDEALEQRMLETGRRFWKEHIETKIAPPRDWQ